MSDVVAPLKMLTPEYKAIEKRLEAVIESKFGIELDEYQRDHLKWQDSLVMKDEMALVFDWHERDFTPTTETFPVIWDNKWSRVNFKWALKEVMGDNYDLYV